ncbi:MAG: hypothetical protein QOD38_178 [Acidimicrobiaceae bacterium]
MKRFLAITASVVMICVAIVIRSSIDDRGGSAAKKPSSGQVTIACVTELAEQCGGLPGIIVQVEDAAVTAKKIAAGTAHIDGWVTFDPWPEIANELARAKVTGKSARLVASRLVIAMVAERESALAPTCGGAVNWKCLGQAIGKQWTEVGGRADWGTVKAGSPAASSGLGLLLLGNAASGYFGNADFATNDFDTDPGFNFWRSNVTSTPASFSEFILKFPAAFSAVGTTDREVQAGKGSRDVALLTPDPAASAVVVLAEVDDQRALDLADDLTALLKQAGWMPDPPDATGLPNPGVLLALSGLAG